MSQSKEMEQYLCYQQRLQQLSKEDPLIPQSSAALRSIGVGLLGLFQNPLLWDEMRSEKIIPIKVKKNPFPKFFEQTLTTQPDCNQEQSTPLHLSIATLGLLCFSELTIKQLHNFDNHIDINSVTKILIDFIDRYADRTQKRYLLSSINNEKTLEKVLKIIRDENVKQKRDAYHQKRQPKNIYQSHRNTLLTNYLEAVQNKSEKILLDSLTLSQYQQLINKKIVCPLSQAFPEKMQKAYNRNKETMAEFASFVESMGITVGRIQKDKKILYCIKSEDIESVRRLYIPFLNSPHS